MSYQYVQSHTDLGRAAGPRLAVLWHMAEGGGTVGFLAGPNGRGVSVHFVIEYSGRTVQMLRLDHMHSSIRSSAIRTTDDPDGFYGRTAALDCLGPWADVRTTLGPNHATIGVEMEGFAATGPNADQRSAMRTLAAYLGIPANLGHRDFQAYKACPGKHVPWDDIGGHGKASGGSDMASDPWEPTQAVRGTFTFTVGGANLIDGISGAFTPVTVGYDRTVFGTAIYNGGPYKGRVAYLGSLGTRPVLMLASHGTFVAAPIGGSDCAHELATANARITRAITDLGGIPA